jgi:hypothetical protein
VKAAAATLPLAVDPVGLPGIYHLGYHSENSFGAAAWLIAPASAAGAATAASAAAGASSALGGGGVARVFSNGPGGGGGSGHSSDGYGGSAGGGFGVMVDSPRYSRALADGVRAALGGAEPRYMVLSHEVSASFLQVVLLVAY